MPTILITRPRQQSANFAEALRAIGAEPHFFPCIEIRPVADTATLDLALAHLRYYDWMIFTSVNTVNAVFERWNITPQDPNNTNENHVNIRVHPCSSVSKTEKTPRIAAVGPKTAQALEARGITTDFVPDEYIAEAILPGLGDLRGRWVLLPTADIAHDTLPRAIQAADGIAHVVTVYRTVPAEPDPEGLAVLREGVDVVTFTSGSTVRNFVRLTQDAGLNPLDLPGNPKVVCIGPKTAQSARDAGFTVDAIPKEYTVEGLVQILTRSDV